MLRLNLTDVKRVEETNEFTKTAPHHGARSETRSIAATQTRAFFNDPSEFEVKYFTNI